MSAAASDKPLRLQVIRLPGRQRHIFNDLAPSLPVSSFQQLLEAQFGVPQAKQALLIAGVPPLPLSTADGSASLASLGVKAGTSIELRESELGDGSSVHTEMKQGKAGSWDVVSFIPTNSGRFYRRDMPRDNSCLFHAIAFLCAAGAKGPASSSATAASGSAASAQSMRELAANIVASDPGKYNSAFLASPNQLYQEHILSPSTWGGGIELAIFAQHFQVEIMAFDLLHLREDVFGSDAGYSKRVFLIYTGDHYDALVFGGSATSSSGGEQCIFSSKDENAWIRARDAIQSMHNELAAQGKCTKQTEWRHRKDLKRAHPASKDADIERERRVQAEKAKISSSSGAEVPLRAPLPVPAASSSSAAAASSVPSHAAAPVLPVSPVNPEDWACPVCTCANKKTARRCAACDNPNPNAPAAAPAPSTAAAPSSGSYVSPPGSFNCAVCTAFNEHPSSRCSVCNSVQPGAAGSSANAPISLDDDDVPPPVPQRSMQLIGGDDDDDLDGPASFVGLTPAQREAMAEPWTCSRCTMLNEAHTISCSACRSPHPSPLLQAGAMQAAARGHAMAGAPPPPPAPTTATERMRAMFSSPPPWVCERCGKSQSAQLFFCSNPQCRNQNTQLHYQMATQQPECSLM